MVEGTPAADWLLQFPDVTEECPLVIGGCLLCNVMTLLGSLFGVLTASDVKVPLGQNFGGMCGSSPAGRFVARSVSRSQSLCKSASKTESRELGVRF